MEFLSGSENGSLNRDHLLIYKLELPFLPLLPRKAAIKSRVRLRLVRVLSDRPSSRQLVGLSELLAAPLFPLRAQSALADKCVLLLGQLQVISQDLGYFGSGRLTLRCW